MERKNGNEFTSECKFNWQQTYLVTMEAKSTCPRLGPVIYLAEKREGINKKL